MTQVRNVPSAQTMQLEVNLFDSLMLEAKAGQR
jgi:hypothetical protein